MTPENTAKLAFVAMLLIGVAAFSVWYRFDTSRYLTYRVVTHDPVSGLIADAPVEMHGVDVGKVERVDLVDARTVDIRLRLQKGAPVTMGTVATVTARGLATRGFTGYVYLALEDDGHDGRQLVAAVNESVPLIRSGPSRTVSLDTTINQVGEDVRRMSELLRHVLDERTIVSLKQATENLQSVSQTLAQNSDKLAMIIANTERMTGMIDAQTVQSLRTAVANLESVTGTLASNNDRLIAVMANAQDASNQLSPLLQSGHEAVNAMRSQLIPEAYIALTRLESATSSLSNTVSKIHRDPSLLLQGRRPQPGPGEAQ
jgi:phospholipid/cholesterol/gamma-HCH transport system substrate-binding protein